MSITTRRRPSAADLTGTWFRPRSGNVERYTDTQMILRGLILALTGLHLTVWDMAGGCYALGATLADGREFLLGDGDGGLPTSLDNVWVAIVTDGDEDPSSEFGGDYVGLVTHVASLDIVQPLIAPPHA